MIHLSPRAVSQVIKEGIYLPRFRASGIFTLFVCGFFLFFSLF